MDMDGPFFSTQRGLPSTKASRKVISIPVHFVDSERVRSDSALKIQKVLRGFMVRKSMKRIAAIKREVDEIERRIVSDTGMVELISRDAKEKLKVNETIMNLVLKLDSVKGIDSGVRDCRKAVIKKAIALQEKVDSIVEGEQSFGAVDESMDIVNAECSGEDENVDCHSSSEIACDHVETMPQSEGTHVAETPKMEAPIKTVDTLLQNQGKMEPETMTYETEEVAEDCGEESVGTGETENQRVEQDISEKQCDDNEIVQSGKYEGGTKESSGLGDRELLERMVKDNEKMMGMMTELFERNEVQTQLLSSLSHRVGQLERAFMCEKMRRKKRNSGNVCVQ
ncbi:BAG family molecular chaperone regulator 5 [Quillaja saponaria]|uniref:BAG family molecular chaperone regulator 5 n=1 Tax=Quillaja saponaria TaxID=32244 RepID=A0AAD7Q6W8_QUISA|nr:BAG family molecular chaperone regulator 5 [Quillaja saponaria]